MVRDNVSYVGVYNTKCLTFSVLLLKRRIEGKGTSAGLEGGDVELIGTVGTHFTAAEGGISGWWTVRRACLRGRGLGYTGVFVYGGTQGSCWYAATP